MAEATAPYGRKTQRAPAVKEVHVLWITAGLGCDGDSVSITAATQPSIEDVLLGAIPGLPKVHLHNPVLAYENGDEFMKFWYQAERGPARPVRPGRRGLDPQREDQEGGLLGRARDRQEDRPADHRPASGSTGSRPRRWPSSRSAPARPTAAFTRWRATRPAAWAWPTTWAGTGSRRPACRSSTCPAARCSPTTSWRRLLYLLYQVAGLAPMIPLDDAAAADLALRQDRARGLRPRRLLRAGRLRPRVRLAQVPGEARLLGAGRQLQRPQARLDGRHRRLPQRRRHLHRLHDARLPRQVHAVHGRAARAHGSRRRPIGLYGRVIRTLREFTNDTANKEPKWRHRRPELTTGYRPTTYASRNEKEQHRWRP